MHPFQVKIEFTKTPKCAKLFWPDIFTEYNYAATLLFAEFSHYCYFKYYNFYIKFNEVAQYNNIQVC